MTFEPGALRAEVPPGTSLLEAARAAGVLLDTPCGGEGLCGKCRVRVRSGPVERGATDLLAREEIEAGWVLACRASVRAGTAEIVVEVPPESAARFRTAEVEAVEDAGKTPPAARDPLVRRLQVEVAAPTLEDNRSDLARLERTLRPAVGDGEISVSPEALRELPAALRASGGRVTATLASRGAYLEIREVVPANGRPPARALGLAVDVGTTTVKAHLVDLVTGRTLGRASKYNSQATYGADVIRRIIWCTERPGGLEVLRHRAVEDVNALVAALSGRLGVERGEIALATVAGNTAMLHLLLGISPEHLRREPYVGAAYEVPPLPARELGLDLGPAALAYPLPCVSAFVGADITAGVLAVRLDESERPCMLIDMGTNGEIVIGGRDWMVAASASAGPAFEGAGTRDGMRSSRGAIDHVRRWDGRGALDFSAIEGAPPQGLCGTAYVDLLAELLRAGAMDRTGSLHPEHASGRVRLGALDVPEFVVVRRGEQGAAREIVLTQNDIANLERAKGAIYAAAKVLLRSLKLAPADLDEVMVAGAFGEHLDVENCVFIGLLPDLPRERLRFVGNTSAAGAVLCALDRGAYARAARLARAVTYFELSTEAAFMPEFTSACFFPHTHIEEFPSVASALDAGEARP